MKLSRGQIEALQFIKNNDGAWYSIESTWYWPDQITWQSLRALQRKKLVEKGDDYPGNIRGIWRITQEGIKAAE